MVREIQSTEDMQINHVIPNYELKVRGIGEGTYSSVDLYGAAEPNPNAGDLFAIKSISACELRSHQIPVYGPSGLEEVFSGKFQLDREIEILERLHRSNSDHIIHIHEILIVGDITNIIYPYRGHAIMDFSIEHVAYSACTGQRVEGFRSLPVPENEPLHVLTTEDASECLRQLISAVEVVHANGICHKDIKPDNVLILAPFSRWWSRFVPNAPSDLHDAPTSPIHVTLCDFNTAEFTRSGGEIYDALGTVLFSPPEVFNRPFTDDESIDASARDMWSVGLLGYALLCGKLPITKMTPLEIQLELIGMIHNIPEGNRISLPTEWPSIPLNSPLKSVIESLLSIIPSDRPTAKQALDNLM
jgi:serine/threonine protein kinase